MLELSNFNTSWKQNCRYLGHGWGFEVFPINCFCITDINHEWELNLWPGDLSSLPDVSRLRAECSWQLSCCRLLDNISPSPAHPGGSISLHRRVNQQTSWEICKKWEERRKSGQNMPVIALQRGGKKAGGMTVMYLGWSENSISVLKESFGNYAHCQHFMSCTNNYRH